MPRYGVHRAGQPSALAGFHVAALGFLPADGHWYFLSQRVWELTIADVQDRVRRVVPLAKHSRLVEVMAAETIRRGMSGRVTASHTTAMHSYNAAYAARLITNIARGAAHGD